MMTPETVTELAEAVRSAPRVLAVGSGTKPRLADVEAAKISTCRLKGIIEYDPAEFTFTALAGTPISDIAAALAEKNQYLPFDPPLLNAGATIGGTVAAGLSGPGRFRFGGVRDFILGVRFVDGMGRLLQMGGKVVKNAAGFDLPKFFVGSLGRFGALAEMTFKVFPRPASSLTLQIPTGDVATALTMLATISRARWEAEALDFLPGSRDIALRIAGPQQALPLLAEEILLRFGGVIVAPREAAQLWRDLGEFNWVPAGTSVIKIPITPNQIKTLYQDHPDAQIHVSSGGNIAWLATSTSTGWNGLTLRGSTPLWTRPTTPRAIWSAIKTALDPEQRFPPLDD